MGRKHYGRTLSEIEDATYRNPTSDEQIANNWKQQKSRLSKLGNIGGQILDFFIPGLTALIGVDQGYRDQLTELAKIFQSSGTPELDRIQAVIDTITDRMTKLGYKVPKSTVTLRSVQQAMKRLKRDSITARNTQTALQDAATKYEAALNTEYQNAADYLSNHKYENDEETVKANREAAEFNKEKIDKEYKAAVAKAKANTNVDLQRYERSIENEK